MTRYLPVIVVAAAVAASVSCGDAVRSDRSPVLLNVATLTPSPVQSDVITLRTSPAPCSSASPCPTFAADSTSATITSSMKNVTLSPTANNQVTITRIHVEYTRADGRNTPGVDVPYAFDNAIAVTITPGGSTSFSFEIVRLVAKQESPLVQLANNGNAISTIATVTFFGTDAVGNPVSVQGQTTVVFSNFGD